MSSRALFVLATCVQLSCLTGILASGSSLWGKKLEFQMSPCAMALEPETEVPALAELSVCMLLRCSLVTEWTAFVYKAPGSSDIELGLQGKSDQLTLWLFGRELTFTKKLNPKTWHSLCVTWSGKQQTVHLYVDDAFERSTIVETSRKHLAPDGTLTLGRSHFVSGGEVTPEFGRSLIGDITQFRIWSTQWSKEQLKGLACVEADVISWDHRHWKTGCSSPTTTSLQCEWSRFKVKAKIIVQYKHKSDYNCSLTTRNASQFWIESIFPSNISVSNIISEPSSSCSVKASSVLHGQQELNASSLCSSCLLVEVLVKAEPAANVGKVQSDLTGRLSSSFSLDGLNVTSDPNSVLVISVVDSFPAATDEPPTANTQSSVRPTPPKYPGTSTRGSLEINNTYDRADIFFRVNLWLQINGSLSHPSAFITALLEKKLNYSSTMKVLNFEITNITDSSRKLNSGPSATFAQQNLYHTTFQVQEDNVYNLADVQHYIEYALFSISNESIGVHTTHLTTRHIVPPDCPEDETVSSLYGTFFWPQTFPQVTQTMRCQDPPDENALRLCLLERTDTTAWNKPNMSLCNPDVTIPQIENITVTTDNAAEVVEALQDLVNMQLSESSELSSDDLDTVVGKLGEVVDVGTDPVLGANLIAIVADILASDTNINAVSNTVLGLTSRMGDTMDFQGTSESITAPALALSLCNVETEGFNGLTFGVSSLSATLEPEIFLNQSFVSDQIQNTKASISLPSEIQSFFSNKNTSRLQFQFYATDELFQDPYLGREQLVNSYIVSASLNSSDVHNLTDRVVVSLSHRKATPPDYQVQCVFWDFQKNGGQGGWNKDGCETKNISQYQTGCLCSHLTHFAILLDVSRAPIGELDSQILTLISYIGCGISAIFLGITLLTYVAFGKIRRDNPSKILINLSSALLGLCMLFLLDSWLSSFSNYGLCIATAATLHYFLLASFTWMGLEALHMYLALVKVFNIYVPSYILKFCAVGWGFPLIIVSLVLAIDKDAYGSAMSEEAAVVLPKTDPFCWVTSDAVFYVTVMGFIFLILLGNLSVFVVVLIQIKRMRINRPSANTKGIASDLRAVASLTVLLGLTWSVGFFSFGPGRVAMMYLFSILNTLQGFFVFLFHCLMKDNVRKQWRILLCFGRSRLGNYPEWSNTASGGHQSKKRHLVNTDSDSSATTTTRKISDSLS